MLSIIIPTLNEAEHLEELLLHLLVICPGAEVIVVDGGSWDGSQEVVRRFPQVRLVPSQRGRARQMNAGARVANGSILLFLHADTRLPAATETAIRESFADLRVVGGRFDVRFDCPRPAFRMIAALMNGRSRVSRIFTGDQAIFVRREVFEALGGYPDIPLMEDVEFTRRLKRKGRLACLWLQVTTSARKWEREGVIRTILLMWTLRFQYFAGVSPHSLYRRYYRNLDSPPSAARQDSERDFLPAGGNTPHAKR
jgi:rSAM/selenodomain-associated transferase 2